MIPLILLVCVLGAALAWLAGLGLLQQRRTGALARQAHERSLHFSPEDGFDIPRRCAAFALVSAGHSPQAANVTHGRLRGLPVRAFDFRYEAGHGTRRQTRWYGAVWVETGWPGPAVLVWDPRGDGGLPLACRGGEEACRGWAFRGDRRRAEAVADACAALAQGGLCVEVRDEAVLFCFPMRRRRDSYMAWLDRAPEAIAAALARELAPPGGRGPSAENGASQAVANPLLP